MSEEAKGHLNNQLLGFHVTGGPADGARILRSWVVAATEAGTAIEPVHPVPNEVPSELLKQSMIVDLLVTIISIAGDLPDLLSVQDPLEAALDACIAEFGITTQKVGE